MKRIFARVPSVLLAVLLQFSPLLKWFQSTAVLSNSPFAIVFKWTFAIATGMGAYHAVSGATTIYISSPTNSVGTNGTAYQYVITQTSPKTDLGHAFGATPLPPGLTVATFQGGFPAYGRIAGTPGAFGVWLVRLTATFTDGSTTFSAVPTNMLLTVYGKPIITNQPVSVATNAGASAAFVVTAGALPAPTYRWRFGTVVMTNETNATLTLNNIDASRAGSYSVIVSNFLGSITSSVATLSVTADPPVITVPPHNASVLEGRSTNFSVVASGGPPLSYFWRKNGAVIPGANAATYPVNLVTTNDAGGYSVIVSNSASTATSGVANLYVVRTPVIRSVVSSGNHVAIEFPRDAGAGYELVYAPAVPTNAWVTLSNMQALATATNTTITDATTNNARRFYQLRATIP